MAMLASARTLTANRLLDRLSDEDFDRLQPHLRPISLVNGRVLYEEWQPIDWSYFPTSGIIAGTMATADGQTIEVSNVGREGATGIAAAFGMQPSMHKTLVQVRGEGFQIGIAELQWLVPPGSTLHRTLLRYFSAYLSQILQSATCNGLHSARQRCCRWLLMAYDRVDGDELLLTHEALGMTLGVRRASVTDALKLLQEEGLISGERGKILVLDPSGLQAACCECHHKVREHYARMLG